jgi:hypothetical protein
VAGDSQLPAARLGRESFTTGPHESQVQGVCRT